MSKQINGDSGRGENYPAFLKQLQNPVFQAKLNAILDDDPSKRMNRATRRLNGKTKAEMDQEALENAALKLADQERIEQFRALKMGEWWRDTFEQLLPKWAFTLTLKGRSNLPVWFGYQWGCDHGNDVVEDKGAPLGHRLQPYSRAWITRKQFVLFGKPVLCKVKREHDGETIKVDTWFKFQWSEA